MNKIIRKLLTSLATLATPITITSCNDSQPVGNKPIPPQIVLDKPDEYYENQVKEMYEVIYQIYEPFTKSGVFAPKEWLEEDQKTIKEQYRQKGIDTFNITFFSIYPPYLEDIKQQKWRAADFAGITTKEDFDTYIIERFKELNKSEEYSDSSKIKKLFEELYLNNQDAYEVLKTNDIFIKTRSDNVKTPNGGFIIPIYENGQVTINTIYSYKKPEPVWFVPLTYDPEPSHIWEVFLIKKNHTAEYNVIKRHIEESAANFKDKVSQWYTIKFAKNYL